MSDEGESSAGSGSLRSAFRHPGFGRFIVATVASAIGDFLYSVGFLVVVYRETGSASWLGIAAFARVGAWAAATAAGGVVGDRYDRRLVLTTLNLAAAVVTFGLAVATAADASVTLIVAIATLLAFVSGLVNPSFAAAVPAIVGSDDVPAANAAVTTVEQVSQVLGPALGAVLVASFSPELAFAINGVSFVVAALLFATVPAGGNAPGDHDEPVRFRDGLTALRSSRPAMVLLGIFVAAVFSYGFSLVLLVLVAVERLGLGPEDVGFLRMAEGVGGVAAAIVAGRLASRSSASALVVAGLVTAATPMLLALTSTTGTALVIAAVGGGALVVLEVIVVSWLQRVVPDELLGRVMGLLMAFGGIATAVGGLLAPVLDDAVGLQWTLVIGGSVLAAAVLLAVPALPGIAVTAERRRAELAPFVDALRGLSLFSLSDDRALERVAGAIDEVQLGMGSTVLREGDPADDLFVVRRGILDVRTSGEAGGAPRLIDTLGPDDWFGEVGLIQNMARTATVATTTETTLWRIPGDVFLSAYEAVPAMPDLVLSRMATSLGRTHPSRARSIRASADGRSE